VAEQPEKTLWGHPRGLYILFTTELWERFSFYTMRGILTLYLVGVVLTEMAAEHGAEKAGGHADQIYGAYLGFVYAATFVGGMLADRLLGQRRAIYIGGFLMSLAQFTLTTHALMRSSGHTGPVLQGVFFVGLGLLACGNGFFKPNISTIVGTLYAPGDKRRDSAFTIFYMGINIGALLGSFPAGVAQEWGWYLGYLMAGIGMIVSLIVMALGRGWIEGRGLPPAGASLWNRGRLGIPNGFAILLGVVLFIPVAGYLMSRPELVQSLAIIVAVPVLAYLFWEAFRAPREEGQRMIVIIVLCLFSTAFWGTFELQGSTITRFTEQEVNRWVLGWELPAAFVANFVNPLLIILLAIPFAMLWLWLDRKGWEPASPMKFALALAQLGLGFLVLWVGAREADATGKCSLGWLLLAFLLLTTGELCLSPVGLSMVTKLSPSRLVGVFMGMWFLSSALGNVIAGGVVGRLQADRGFGAVFLLIAAAAGASSVLLFVFSPALQKMMHGVK